MLKINIPGLARQSRYMPELIMQSGVQCAAYMRTSGQRVTAAQSDLSFGLLPRRPAEICAIGSDLVPITCDDAVRKGVLRIQVLFVGNPLLNEPCPNLPDTYQD